MSSFRNGRKVENYTGARNMDDLADFVNTNKEQAGAAGEAVQDGGSGVTSEWAHDVTDPTTNLQATEVSPPPGPGSTPPGQDIVNFVPRPDAQPEHIFPEMSHEEKLHLLHR